MQTKLKECRLKNYALGFTMFNSSVCADGFCYDVAIMCVHNVSEIMYYLLAPATSVLDELVSRWNSSHACTPKWHLMAVIC